MRWTKDEAQIIKACWATDQGKLALQVIVNRVCNLMGPAETALDEGRRRAGIDIAHAINTPLDRMTFEEDHDRSNGVSRTITATERAARAAVEQHVASAGSKRPRKRAAV